MIDKSKVQEMKSNWEPVSDDEFDGSADNELYPLIDKLVMLYKYIDRSTHLAAGCRDRLKAHAECYVGIRCMAYFMKDGTIEQQWQRIRKTDD